MAFPGVNNASHRRQLDSNTDSLSESPSPYSLNHGCKNSTVKSILIDQLKNTVDFVAENVDSVPAIDGEVVVERPGQDKHNLGEVVEAIRLDAGHVHP